MKKKILRAIKLHKMLKYRGNSEKFRKESINLYGQPSEKLVDDAKKILIKNIETYKYPYNNYKLNKNINSFYIKKSLENTLNENNINGWSVVFKQGNGLSVSNYLKQILIGKNKKVSGFELEKYKVHEIMTHVFRAENGLNQFRYSNGNSSLNFLVDLGNYMKTEEGLAIYNQILNGLMPVESYVKIATNVLAVDSMLKDNDFKTTFAMFKDLGLDNEFAWSRTLRAYRSGGFTKDIGYLQGLREIDKFIEKKRKIK